MNKQNVKLKGGVIIIGSLLWQDDLNGNANLRRDWRENSLDLCNKILAKLPIRYGRYSNGNIYTMVFSTNCEKTNKLGTGYIIPLKKNPINHLDILISEARMMAEAEGMNSKFIGGKNNIWGSMGILINKNKVAKDLVGKILTRWLKDFKADGVGRDTSEYRVGKEKISITKNGELQINWPKAFDDIDNSKIDEIDFLIAASTKPKYEISDQKKYPSASEIAQLVRNDTNRRYFINNFFNRITTFQDVSVINLT